MADKLIDYDGLAQEALRGVVRGVLEQVLRDGIPGDHHFYIAFDTRAPGVTLSRRLREQYPDEMTIVLQHRFWDLKVESDRFEVKLTFDSIPELLGVPYAAIKVFFDPSVPYGLQFEPSGQATPNRQTPAIVEFVGGPDGEEDSAAANGVAALQDSGVENGLQDNARLAPSELGNNGNGAADHVDEDDDDQGEQTAEIVQLDAFRRK
ncbi:MAG: ClpXP protease specificity-enhancing factor SspB [Pseudomonadota bacterium]